MGTKVICQQKPYKVSLPNSPLLVRPIVPNFTSCIVEIQEIKNVLLNVLNSFQEHVDIK